jgi:hypothetical protein
MRERRISMSVSDTAETPSDETIALITPRRTRIDPPHQPAQDDSTSAHQAADDRVESAESTTGVNPLTDEPVLLEVEEPTDEMVAAVLGQSLDSRREQLQVQVGQLAGHLRERLREVDRREAAINARSSQLESELRASRLWLRERELGFQERENELKRTIEELEARSTSVQPDEDTPGFDAEARQAELNELARQLQLREDQLRERRFEADRQAAALCHAQQVWQQQRESEERQLTLQREHMNHDFRQLTAEREEQLRAAELLLNEHAQQLNRDRTALVTDRDAWEQQKSRQRQAIEELRATTEAELADRRQRLDARQQWIERQRGGLDQVRNEASLLHRQSIEMRLLVEQLWSQITGCLTPAEVAQSIAQLRLKLAEQYRIEEQQLTARRDALVELSERIAAQHRELTQLRSGLRDWAAARQIEIEQQAAALVQRELTLDAQQEQLRQAQQQWNFDRRQYEQQIRDLTSQLRAQPVAA